MRHRSTIPAIAGMCHGRGARRIPVDRVALTIGGVVSGLRQGLPLAVAALVLIEFIGSNSGLGYALLGAASRFDSVGMLAIFLAIAVPTAIVTLILDSAERQFALRLR